jgi:hypothetical protein
MDRHWVCHAVLRKFVSHEERRKNILFTLGIDRTQRKFSLHFVTRGEIVPIAVAVVTANDHDLPGWFSHQANNWQNCIIDFNPKEATSTIQTFC